MFWLTHLRRTGSCRKVNVQTKYHNVSFFLNEHMVFFHLLTLKRGNIMEEKYDYESKYNEWCYEKLFMFEFIHRFHFFQRCIEIFYFFHFSKLSSHHKIERKRNNYRHNYYRKSQIKKKLIKWKSCIRTYHNIWWITNKRCCPSEIWGNNHRNNKTRWVDSKYFWNRNSNWSYQKDSSYIIEKCWEYCCYKEKREKEYHNLSFWNFKEFYSQPFKNMRLRKYSNYHHHPYKKSYNFSIYGSKSLMET